MRRFEFQTNLSHLWWGRKRLCYTVGRQIFVRRSIRTLNISPLPPSLSPPPPPPPPPPLPWIKGKNLELKMSWMLNIRYHYRDYKNVELSLLRNINNWHQGHGTCYACFKNVLASELRFCNQYSSIQSIFLMVSFLFFPLTWVVYKLKILDRFS